jgi:hypothetical protein
VPISGWHTGQGVTWDEVATGKASPARSVLVIDELQDATAPLTAVKPVHDGCARSGS